MAADIVLARNPDPDSKLPYLLWLPLGDGLVFRTRDTWPRTKALFCHPVSVDEWPENPDIVERVPVRSCVRRGAAIDLVLDRGRENRSQIVYTKGRGRDMVFWQSPRTRKQARPNVRTPTARAAGVEVLTVVVDSHERYAYKFPGQQVETVTAPLACGDYGLVVDDTLVASVERKSLADLVSSLTSGKLRFALAELAALNRAAVVVEDRYSAVFKLEYVRPALVADGLAELQVRYPNVPIVFCENRQLAEEWTYRYLAAVQQAATDEQAAAERILQPPNTGVEKRQPAPPGAEPTTAQIRAWAREQGFDVPDRGRLRPEIRDAWRSALTRPE
ncbi:ERCC4 domain-containing protein [Rhodococcus triatomae]